MKNITESEIIKSRPDLREKMIKEENVVRSFIEAKKSVARSKFIYKKGRTIILGFNNLSKLVLKSIDCK